MEQVAETGEARAAVQGPRLAAEVVAMAAGAGIRLDYSPHSLALVDRIIDGLRRAHPPAAPAGRTVPVRPSGPAPHAGDSPHAGAENPPSAPSTLTALGGYTGEVLRRHAGAEWVDFDAGQREVFGQPFGIRSADGRVWNPLGKAVKRYQAGDGESLRLFYLAVAGHARA